VAGETSAAACTTHANSVSGAIAAEQNESPTITPTYSISSGVVTSNLIPTYLQSWPSSTEYTVSLSSDGSAVEVSLAGIPERRFQTWLLSPVCVKPITRVRLQKRPLRTTRTTAASLGKGVCAVAQGKVNNRQETSVNTTSRNDEGLGARAGPFIAEIDGKCADIG
jgi:hypothetical protein